MLLYKRANKECVTTIDEDDYNIDDNVHVYSNGKIEALSPLDDEEEERHFFVLSRGFVCNNAVEA